MTPLWVRATYKVGGFGGKPHYRVAVQGHGTPAHRDGHSLRAFKCRKVAGGPGKQVVGMGLGIVLGQAFLVPLTDHHAAVGALADVNLPPAVTQRRGVHDGHVLQQREQRVGPQYHAGTFRLGHVDAGQRGQEGWCRCRRR